MEQARKSLEQRETALGAEQARIQERFYQEQNRLVTEQNDIKAKGFNAVTPMAQDQVQAQLEANIKRQNQLEENKERDLARVREQIVKARDDFLKAQNDAAYRFG